MKYIIDIDGTICENGSCESCKYEGSTPIKERIDVINQLYDDGHTIFFQTARGMGRSDNSAIFADVSFCN